MKVQILIGVAAFGAVFTLVTNWLALIPWRMAKGKHWSERARLYHPVRAAATSNLWALPAVLTLASVLLWGDEAPHWMLLAFVSALAVQVANIPMSREVFPRIPTRELLRLARLTWAMRFLIWFVFLGAVALVPDRFDLLTAVIVIALVGLCWLWNHTGWILVGRWLGLFRPPPDRLRRIVEETSGRMNIPFGDVWLMQVPLAQAFAMPVRRRLLFAERLLALLSDDEISAICAHELGHLSEARSQYYRRYVVWMVFLPWVLFKPMVHTLGVPGFVLLLLTTVLSPLIYRDICRRLELRADEIACLHEPDPGVYARALTRLYEDNLLPAVHGRQHGTHPHLYDRLLAAGVTPDFPRPLAAASTAWQGVLVSAALGGLAMAMMIRLVN